MWEVSDKSVDHPLPLVGYVGLFQTPAMRPGRGRPRCSEVDPELQLVMESDRRPSMRDGRLKQREPDEALSDSELLYRYEGRVLRSSTTSGPGGPMARGGMTLASLGFVGSGATGRRERPRERVGPMEKMPMSPVSVVFLSMVSRGAGERRKEAFPPWDWSSGPWLADRFVGWSRSIRAAIRAAGQ